MFIKPLQNFLFIGMCSQEKKKEKVESKSWIHKKAAMDSEEPLLKREVDEILSLVTAFQYMDEVQLRKSFLSNHSLQNREIKAPAIKQAPKSSIRSNLLQVHRSVRSIPPKYNANSLMAAVWKFHSEEEQMENHVASIT